MKAVREVHRHYCPKCGFHVVCAKRACDLDPVTWSSCFACGKITIDTKSSLQHQRASKAGLASEDLWQRCHNACDVAKIATVWKIPTPTVKGKDGRLIYTHKSLVDFMGHTSTGRTVLAESKSNEDGYFAASIFKAHQREILDNGLKSHALCLVLLACDSKLRVAPWHDVCDAKGFRFDDVGHAVDAGEAYLRRWA